MCYIISEGILLFIAFLWLSYRLYTGLDYSRPNLTSHSTYSFYLLQRFCSKNSRYISSSVRVRKIKRKRNKNQHIFFDCELKLRYRYRKSIMYPLCEASFKTFCSHNNRGIRSLLYFYCWYPVSQFRLPAPPRNNFIVLLFLLTRSVSVKTLSFFGQDILFKFILAQNARNNFVWWLPIKSPSFFKF